LFKNKKKFMSLENPSGAAGKPVAPESKSENTEDDLKKFDTLANLTEAKITDFELIKGSLKEAVRAWDQKPDREWVESKFKNIRREIFDDLIKTGKWSHSQIASFLALESNLISESLEYAKAVWDQDKNLDEDTMNHFPVSGNRRANRKKAGETIGANIERQLADPSIANNPLKLARLKGQSAALDEEYTSIIKFLP
jgi:hypothetical protein